MSVVAETARDATVGVAIADTREGLSAIRQPGCAAAIWRRRAVPSFQSWIDGLDPERLPAARVVLPAADVRDATVRICEAAGTPDCAERTRLIDDTAALAEMFADLMNASYLRLRLDVVTSNACRKFHVDTITARLICTLRGTGTQYGISIDGAEPQRILTVPTGAPILLRGLLWPERPKSGLLHRSPPIAGTGETRLVLVLDPMPGPDEFSDLPTMQ